MGLASDQSLEQPRTDEEIGGQVVDIIVMKESYGIVHAPGIVAILGDCRPSDPQGLIGRTACIRTPDGLSRLARIDATRDHGKTISFFFKGLASEDVPIGSFITLKP
jgi:hypothetical protein